MGFTVMLAVPLTPSLVAVIVAMPEAWAVTKPVEETVAVAALLVVHVTSRPVRTFLAMSKVVAVNPSVLPTTIVALVGATVTLATGRPEIVNSSVPMPFVPRDVVTTMSYDPGLAVTATVIFAVNWVELTY